MKHGVQDAEHERQLPILISRRRRDVETGAEANSRPQRQSTLRTSGRSASMRINQSMVAAISFTATGRAM